MYRLQTPTQIPFVTMRVPFPEGVTYLVRLEWNMRAGWFFALSDAAGDPIVSARRLVCDWDMLRTCVDVRRPPGGIYLLDTTGRHEDAGYDDLGVRHLLYYFTADEVAEAAG